MHVDAEVLFPHLLDRFGNDAVRFQRIVQEFDGRKAFSVG